MPRNAELQERKESLIKQEFLTKKKEKKFTTPYIIQMLCAKFFLSERTIEAIVYGEYDRKREKKVLA